MEQDRKENSVERDLDRLAVPTPNTRQSGLTTAFITRLLSEIDFNIHNAKSILILQHYNSNYSYFFIDQLVREALIFGYNKSEIKIINKRSIIINGVKITVDYCNISFYSLIRKGMMNCMQTRGCKFILDLYLFDIIGNIPDTYLLFDYNLVNIFKGIANKEIYKKLDFI